MPDDEDLFGWSVDIDGALLAIGAPGEDSSGDDPSANDSESSGAVYMFRQDTDGWQEEALIKASNSDSGDLFGHRVALYGSWLAVSAIDEDSVLDDPDDNTASGAGAVYLFEKLGDAWVERAILKAPNLSINDGFGASLAISDTILLAGSPGEELALFENTLLVGSPGESSAANTVNGDQTPGAALGSGAAYVFHYQDNLWQQRAYIKASNSESGDFFGFQVGLSDALIVVSSPSEDGDEDDISASSGAIYLFDTES